MNDMYIKIALFCIRRIKFRGSNNTKKLLQAQRNMNDLKGCI